MITCQICSKQFRHISNTHLKKHGITQKQYFEMFPGIPWRDEDLNEKQSNFMLARWQDSMYREEMEQLNVGRKHTDGTKYKISIALSGEGNPNYGKICTPEEVEFRRKIMAGWERTPEYREKLSRAGRGQGARRNPSLSG